MSAIQSININNLQRLRNIQVDFDRAGVTAIMGANGSGKTTLLQSLACVYRRDTDILIDQVTYSYNDFFKPYDGNDWAGSSYQVRFYDRDDLVDYSKDPVAWKPRSQNRTTRYVKYISILDCAPHQEKEKENAIGAYNREEIGLSVAKKRTLLNKVSAALHWDYEDTGYSRKANGLREFFYARTNDRSHGVLEYPSHYMGAGEQKIIHIINEVLKAPRGALILIEELDVSLHESAIRSLINFLIEQAEDNSRQLQIVFNTHWLGIQDFINQLKVVSLYEDPDSQNIVLRNGFDPQFIHNLNGDYCALRQIKVWVEDGLSLKIVEQVAQECRLREFVEIKSFGSVQNAFTMAGAIAVSGEKLDRTIILTDGDCYLTQPEKQAQINNSIDGNGELAEQWRTSGLQLIVDLASPNQEPPEKVLLDLCRSYVESGNAPQWLAVDLLWIAQRIPEIDGKQAIHALSEHKNMDVSRIEAMILQEASRSEDWGDYIAPLVEKMSQTAQNIGVPAREEEAA